MSRGIVIPYFKSEWGMAYTQQQQTEHVSPRGSKSAGATSNSYMMFFLIIFNLILYIRIIKW
jgi:hypothetical protein